MLFFIGGEEQNFWKKSQTFQCSVLRQMGMDLSTRNKENTRRGFSASVNSHLGNGSFWLEICHAEHVDRRS